MEKLIILDGLKAHYNIVEKIDTEKENIVFHFLVAHSSDQTQQLYLGLFGIMKKFQQNFQIIKGLSQQTNQIIKIIISLYRSAIPPTCKSAFKAAVITSKIRYDNGSITELAHFDLMNCSKVRHYSKAYINELVFNGKPLSINQITLYRQYRQQENQRGHNRFPLTYFPNK